MSRIEESQKRLSAAVARLEAALKRQTTDEGADGDADDGAARRQFDKEMAEARAAHDALAGVADEVAGRLDAAIGRLDSALAGLESDAAAPDP